MTRFIEEDEAALARAATVLEPLLRRRGWFDAMGPPDGPDDDTRILRASIVLLLGEIEGGDPPPYEDDGLEVVVLRSGLVLARVGRTSVPVALVESRGGRAARLLVP